MKNEQVTDNAHISPFHDIPGLDAAKGIAMIGGKTEFYKKILSLFCKDAEKRLLILQTAPNADGLPQIVSHAHAIKGASASIGAAGISARAAEIEAAGKAGNMAFVQENLAGFAGQLEDLVKNIQAALEPGNAVSQGFSGSPPPAALSLPLLKELSAALESQKAGDIDRILEELARQDLDAGAKEALEQISDEVLTAEFEKAGQILNGLLNKESL